MNVLYTFGVVAGVLLALAITANIVRALIITRARRTVMFDAVDEGVAFLFRVAARPLPTYERKDQLLAAQGAVVILAQLATWLIGYELAYALLLLPTVNSFSTALREAGSSMFTLGFIYTHGNEPAAIDVIAAATGMIVVALQIAYLPTLYSAFNRRETEVTLLGARAGHPPWGPELLLAYPLRRRGADRRPAGLLQPLGTLGGRRGREPFQLPRAGALPLAAPSGLVARRAALGDGLRRHAPGTAPIPGPDRAQAGHSDGLYGLA